METKSCDVRHSAFGVPPSTEVVVEAEPREVAPPPSQVAGNPARRTPHATRRLRRLRVGRDGIFPW